MLGLKNSIGIYAQCILSLGATNPKEELVIPGLTRNLLEFWRLSACPFIRKFLGCSGFRVKPGMTNYPLASKRMRPMEVCSMLSLPIPQTL